MKEEYNKWNKIKQITENKKPPIIKNGLIFWCRIGYNIGYEENGKGDYFQRPVIIIRKFSGNFALIAPLTSKEHKGDWYLQITIKGEKSYVILNQIKPIDTRRLEKNIGQINDNTISEIINAYKKLLDNNL